MLTEQGNAAVHSVRFLLVQSHSPHDEQLRTYWLFCIFHGPGAQAQVSRSSLLRISWGWNQGVGWGCALKPEVQGPSPSSLAVGRIQFLVVVKLRSLAPRGPPAVPSYTALSKTWKFAFSSPIGECLCRFEFLWPLDSHLNSLLIRSGPPSILSLD